MGSKVGRFSGAVLLVALAVLLSQIVIVPLAQAKAQKKSDLIVLAFESSATVERTRALHLMAPNGSGFRRIATSGSVEAFDISANGKKIVYATDSGIWTVGVNGKNDRKLLGRPGLTYMTPSWSPNGKSVWFSTYGPVQGLVLERFTIQTGKRESIVLDGANDDARVHRVDVSPSGGYVVVVPTTTFIGDTALWPILVDLSDGSTTELSTDAKEPTWLGDDVLVWEEEGVYVAHDVRTGASVELALAGNWLRSIAVAPDGSRLLEATGYGQEIELTSVDLITGRRAPFTKSADEFAAEGQMQWTRSSIKAPKRLCYGWVITKSAGKKANTITGTPGGDVIAAGGGNDVVRTGGGNDVVCGGAGNDRIDGGDGQDILFGESGADRVWGRLGDDTLTGGGGKDVMSGGAGKDWLFGNDGDGDTANGGADFDRCIDTDNPVECESSYVGF